MRQLRLLVFNRKLFHNLLIKLVLRKMVLGHLLRHTHHIPDGCGLHEDGVDLLQGTAGGLGVEEVYDWDEGCAEDGVDDAASLCQLACKGSWYGEFSYKYR